MPDTSKARSPLRRRRAGRRAPNRSVRGLLRTLWNRGATEAALLVTAAAVASGVVFGAGVARATSHTSDGQTWVSTDDGAIVRINPVTGEAVTKVQTPVTGTVKVQQGSGVVVVTSPSTGEVVSIDVGELAASQTRTVDPATTRVRMAGKVTYIAELDTGVVRVVDTVSMVDTGQSYVAAGPLADMVVDQAGTVWALGTDGALASIHYSADIGRFILDGTTSVSGVTGESRMIPHERGVTVLSPATHSLVQRGTGRDVQAVVAELDGTVLPAPSSPSDLVAATIDGSTDVVMLSGGQVLVASTDATSCESPGAPAVFAERVYVPCNGQGRTVVLDRSGTVARQDIVTGGDEDPQIIVDDDALVVTSADAGKAVTVDVEGKQHPTQLKDPDIPVQTPTVSDRGRSGVDPASGSRAGRSTATSTPDSRRSTPRSDDAGPSTEVSDRQANDQQDRTEQQQQQDPPPSTGDPWSQAEQHGDDTNGEVPHTNDAGGASDPGQGDAQGTGGDEGAGAVGTGAGDRAGSGVGAGQGGTATTTAGVTTSSGPADHRRDGPVDVRARLTGQPGEVSVSWQLHGQTPTGIQIRTEAGTPVADVTAVAGPAVFTMPDTDRAVRFVAVATFSDGDRVKSRPSNRITIGRPDGGNTGGDASGTTSSSADRGSAETTSSGVDQASAAPGEVTIVDATSSGNQVTVDWSGGDGAAAWQVQWTHDGETLIGDLPADATTASHTYPAGLGTVTVAVIALNDGGQARAEATVDLDTDVPRAPDAVTIDSAGSLDNTVTVGWSGGQGATTWRVEWTKDGQTSTDLVAAGTTEASKTYAAGGGTVQVAVTAVNDVGETRADTTVDLDQVPPGEVSIESATADDQNVAAVSWSGGDLATSWSVTWTLDGDSQSDTLDATATSASHDFPPGAGSVSVTVTAINDAGKKSDSGSIALRQPAPPSDVQIDAADADANNVATVSWSGGTGATSWKVAWTKDGDTQTDTVDGAASSASHNYPAGTGDESVSVTVTAVNVTGEASATATITLTQVAPPGEVTGLDARSSGNTVTVNWSGGSGATSWTVSYSRDGGDPVTHSLSAGSSSDSQAFDTGLGTVDITVTASNDGGSTDAATSVELDTPGTDPRNLSLTGGTAQATASWDAPESGADSYEVAFLPDGAAANRINTTTDTRSSANWTSGFGGGEVQVTVTAFKGGSVIGSVTDSVRVDPSSLCPIPLQDGGWLQPHREGGPLAQRRAAPMCCAEYPDRPMCQDPPCPTNRPYTCIPKLHDGGWLQDEKTSAPPTVNIPAPVRRYGSAVALAMLAGLVNIGRRRARGRHTAGADPGEGTAAAHRTSTIAKEDS